MENTEKMKLLKPPQLEGLFKKAVPWLKKGFFISVVACSGGLSVLGTFFPFAIPLTALFFLKTTQFYACAALSLGSMLIFGSHLFLLKYIAAFVLAAVCNAILRLRVKQISLLQRAFLAALCLFLAGVLQSAVMKLSSYVLFIATVESILAFALTIVFQKGYLYLMQDGTGVAPSYAPSRAPSYEETVGFCVVLAVFTASLGEITPQGISLRTATACLFVLIAARQYGAGTACVTACTIGFVLLLCQREGMAFFAALAVSAMLCGTVAELGKLPTAISFLSGFIILAFCTDKALLSFPALGSAFIATLVFCLLPKALTAKGSQSTPMETKYYSRMKAIATESLQDYSQTFYALSSIFDESLKHKNNTKSIAGELMDQVAQRVCQTCGLANYCWRENLYETGRAMRAALKSCVRKGTITNHDIAPAFIHKCAKAQSFVQALNDVYGMHRSRLVLENKLTESRRLVSRLLRTTGDLTDSLAQKMDVRGFFKEDLEQEILAALEEEAGGDFGSISVLRDTKGEYHVTIAQWQCHGEKLCTEKIIPIVSSVLGRKMRRTGTKACGEKTGCTLELYEAGQLQAAFAANLKTKEGSSISGDTYSYMELKNGDKLIALSDGMGSGELAHTQSKTAIELMEQLSYAGFPFERCVEFINSLLMVRAREESFATLDICILDLYNKKLRFMKSGAAPSFLIRNGTVLPIRCQSLPAGILSGIEIDTFEMEVMAGDILLMMSDGVSDIMATKSKTEEIWLKNLFSTFNSYNPRDIADHIMAQAQKATKGRLEDDMSLTVTRIWEGL